MANYCENRLSVQGDKKQLQEFMGLLVKKDGNIDFNKIVPIPKAYDKDDRWYDWCIKNWGCKWSPYEDSANVSYEKGDEYAELDFDTPWSPPCEFLKRASEKFPKLHFSMKYDEGGMCFMGVYQAKAGKILKDECVNY